MKENLKSQMKAAMKAKDKPRLSTIRSLLSAIQYQEMEAKVDSLDDEKILGVIRSEVKKRKESLEFAEKAEREDEQTSLKAEIAVLEEFLPAQLDETGLRSIVEKFQQENSEASLGDIMKHLSGNYAGQFDGKLASQVARSVLGN